MFVERSAVRIRLVRTLFVLLGIAPCVGLAAWAVHLHSDALRQELEGRCAAITGLPVHIGRVEHLRPDGIRLLDVSIAGPTGSVMLVAPTLDVETSATEVRLSLGSLCCTPALAGVLGDLAREWLARPVRFPRDCVIDIVDFRWSPRDADPPVRVRPDAAAGGQACRAMHVECVAANGSRAIRLRHSAADGSDGDEVRIVASAPGLPKDGPTDLPAFAERLIEISGGVREPVPLPVVAAVAGLRPGQFAWGADAAVRGSWEATIADGGSSGSARGTLENVDLAAAGRGVSPVVAGRASLELRRVAWIGGRLVECAGTVSASRGRVDQRLLDGLVSVLGCRPGPAFRSLTREEMRTFDEASAAFRIDTSGLELRAVPGRAGVIASAQGLVMLEEPGAPVPLERLAWLAASPGAAAVPASPTTVWLLQALPIAPPDSGSAPTGRPQNAGRPAPAQAGRPARRAEF